MRAGWRGDQSGKARRREGGRPPPTYVRTGREEKRDERGGITPGKLHNTGLLNQDLNP